ncbi:MAG: hypothetical protein J6B32_06115 [Spirochaetaceae bacterium]|nr:hypothetical protein [Spirochaetaceae bacterium]MBO5236665.1 hypothetical protein [Spirochaetaceae bacterium]
MKKQFFYVALATIFTIIIFSGCYSVPKDIPSDLSAEELIQLAQSSYDDGNVKAAQAYYEAVIIRYSSDMALVVEAEYEIAHMKIKEKKWQQAIPDLQRILSYYESDYSGILPQAYKKLAQLDLDKVPEFELRKAAPESFVTE